MALLEERKHDTALGRALKRQQKDIAAHYRDEVKRMERTGKRDLVGYV